MASRPLRLFTLAVLLALGMPSVALADADPASDVLVAKSVFYPYSPAVSGSLQQTLNAEAAAASRTHFPIRVALIDAPTDLGGIPSFFNKPRPYAHFLYQEIAFLGKRPLLVVMPDGYGLEGVPHAVAAAALPKLAGRSSDDLARAAIMAVPALAAAAGHPIKRLPIPSAAGGNSSGGASIPAVAILAAVAVGAATTIFGLRVLWPHPDR